MRVLDRMGAAVDGIQFRGSGLQSYLKQIRTSATEVLWSFVCDRTVVPSEGLVSQAIHILATLEEDHVWGPD